MERQQLFLKRDWLLGNWMKLCMIRHFSIVESQNLPINKVYLVSEMSIDKVRGCKILENSVGKVEGS